MHLSNMDDTDTNKLDKNILELLWKLASNTSDCRIVACSDILHTLQSIQDGVQNGKICKELLYCVERLVKGLASSRDAARLGFALLLTEILKQFDVVNVEDVLEMIKKHLTLSSNLEKKDAIFGQLFAYSAIIRSGRLADHSHLSFVILALFDLFQGKSYIMSASYEILLNIFAQISCEKFQESVWPHIRSKLINNWETSTADSLWPLVLCRRLFPKVVSEKFLRKHWNTSDIFSSENFGHLMKMIRQTTSCLPVLHPLCTEIIALLPHRKDTKEFWNSVIDDNLFEADLTEKAFVGFEMVKRVLQDTPKKKIIKIVLSPKFCTMFSKSLLFAKHPMNPAATCLASFLSDFVKQSNDPKIQMLILKVYLQPPGTLLCDQIFQRKEVSTIVQCLLPEGVKLYCEFLKSIAINKFDSNKEEINIANFKRIQAVIQIGTLACHPVTITDIEWRLSVVKFLFLHSFFRLKAPAPDLLHCETDSIEVTDMRPAFKDAFFKTVNSMYHRTEQRSPSLEHFIEHLLLLTEYVDQLLVAVDSVQPLFPLEMVQESWSQMKSTVHKLGKQSRKDGKTNESHAFQALFLELAFHLFYDAEHISGVIEELQICCKKALNLRKHDKEERMEEEGDGPAWVGVVVDILLSLLSKCSQHLRLIVTSVFPLLCSFIDEDALQQILAVINPAKAEEDPMLIDEDEESDAEFDSGSSSDESDSNEPDDTKVDEQFRKKVKEALGNAAEVSDADSVVLSDSEMFKLDDAIAKAFKSRVQTGHTQLDAKDTSMLYFRIRSLSLVMSYLKSEPPMHLVLLCIQPLLDAYKYARKSKHQAPLLHKVVSTLQILTQIKKFQHQDNVSKSELKTLLEDLISKCHRETDLTVAQKLYSLCVFLVLCFRRLGPESPSRKSKKVPSYIKLYLNALATFVKESNSNMFPQFFVLLMESCPELSYNFIGPCQEYAFAKNVRPYKRTQCLGLIFEALKFSKAQSSVTSEEWLAIGNTLIPSAVDNLKEVINNSSVKSLYFTELLDVICTCNSIVKEKTNQSLIERHKDLLPLLSDMNKNILKKLTKKGNSVRRKIIIALGGKIPLTAKKVKPVTSLANGTELDETSSPEKNPSSDVEDSQLSSEKKQKKRKSKKKDKKCKKQKKETDKGETLINSS